jgi:mono/diheme cytochrome c family protein
MTKVVCFTLGVLLIAGSAAAADKKPITPQAQRGRDLFTNSPKGTPCGTCHFMDGTGTAVGPDLTKLASVVGPRGLVMTIQMSMTAYVQEVKTPTGTFPGIQKEKNGDAVQIWDLSKMPPVLRTLQASEISSMKQNEKWKHPPTLAGYSSQELADIIAFLKWASNGSQKEVTPADVE